MHTIKPATIEEIPYIAELIIHASEATLTSQGTHKELTQWQEANASYEALRHQIYDPNILLLTVETINPATAAKHINGTAYGHIQNNTLEIGNLSANIEQNTIVKILLIEAIIKWGRTQQATQVFIIIPENDIETQHLAETFKLKKHSTTVNPFFPTGNFNTWNTSL